MIRFLFIILIFFSCSTTVFAAETNNFYEDSVEDFVQEYKIDFEQIKENPFEFLWEIVINSIKTMLLPQFEMFAKAATVLILTSFIGFFTADKEKQFKKLISIISVFVILNNTFSVFLYMTEDAGNVFFEIKNFMISFLPVFAGISFASGEMVTSTVYTGVFMVCVVTVANFCVNYIVPSLNFFMAVGITSSVSSVINLKPLCSFYSRLVKTVMTVAVSVICFTLSLQTTISQGQDTLAVKTGKMIVTSAVPIIGSTLQGAIASIYASMSVLKGFFGVAGIAVILNIFLPHIIRMSIYWVGFFLLSILSEILDNDTASELFGTHREAVEILLSVSVLFLILLLFSISIMIKIFEGV